MEKIRHKSIEVYEQALNVAQYYVSERYKNNFSGNGDDFIHKLRSNIQHRVESVGWHYINLESMHERAESEYFVNVKNDNEHQYLLQQLRIQYFIFDDIVFNLLSLFEYTGNLVGYFLKERHGKKLKWKGVSKSARDKNNEFYKTDIAQVIDKADRNLVTKLEDYRAKLFHYENDMGSIGTKIEFASERAIQIQIEMPNSFKKIFKDIEIEEKNNQLLSYSKYAILSSIEVVLNILTLLQEWEVEAIENKI